MFKHIVPFIKCTTRRQFIPPHNHFSLYLDQYLSICWQLYMYVVTVTFSISWDCVKINIEI